jgi:hypothetical protein
MGYGTRLWSLTGRTLIGAVHVPFGFDRADLSPAPRRPSPRS